MKISIKCKIHLCTIKFAEHYLNTYFTDEEIEFLEDSLKARIDTQYYINRNVPDKQFQNMIKNAPKFLIKCKRIILKLKEDEMNNIRKNTRQHQSQ